MEYLKYCEAGGTKMTIRKYADISDSISSENIYKIICHNFYYVQVHTPLEKSKTWYIWWLHFICNIYFAIVRILFVQLIKVRKYFLVKDGGIFAFLKNKQT